MIRFLAGVPVALALLLAPAGPAPFTVSAHAENPVVAEGPTTPLTLTTATGVYPLEVEVAATPSERALGLMFRRKMAPDHGMLFDMGRTEPVSFWMENTYVSLDILFIGEDGRVAALAQETTPLSRALIPSGRPVRYVLELVAGSIRRMGIKPGDTVAHDLIGR